MVLLPMSEERGSIATTWQPWRQASDRLEQVKHTIEQG